MYFTCTLEGNFLSFTEPAYALHIKPVADLATLPFDFQTSIGQRLTPTYQNRSHLQQPQPPTSTCSPRTQCPPAPSTTSARTAPSRGLDSNRQNRVAPERTDRRKATLETCSQLYQRYHHPTMKSCLFARIRRLEEAEEESKKKRKAKRKRLKTRIWRRWKISAMWYFYT